MITDYTSLQAEIASWIHRSDLSASIPTFISMAEAKMNGDLESRSMEVRVTLVCNPDGTLNARLVTLPNDVLEMRRLLLMNEPAVVLEYKSPDQLVADNGFQLSPGCPLDFTVIANSIELSPPPDKAYPLELVYKQRLPVLSGTNTTNWALLQNPNLYLFGALLASVPFTKNTTDAPTFAAEYQKAVETVNLIDWYSGSTMRVRAR
ncbi:MAG: hypothetical protein JWQ89_3707 [Devosia sp.]|uniref:phage adaptor protein n=1 Tax=Devosia sp. TaxID=1871048 RepID=UPI00261FFAC2|nr:hypothetical protein [Devosia sp.]MDB5541980.1 hypothetical protein [Devosia sp.]